MYGTVRTVVWEDGGGDPASYPIAQKGETMSENPIKFQIVKRAFVLAVLVNALWKGELLKSWGIAALVYMLLSLSLVIYVSQKLKEGKSEPENDEKTKS